MLDAKIAGARENIDAGGMELAYGKGRVKRRKGKWQAAVRVEKRGFSELTVIFRNMLVHLTLGADRNMESPKWKMRIEIEVAKVRCVVGQLNVHPKAEAFRPVKKACIMWGTTFAVAHSDTRANASLAQFVIVNHFSYYLLSTHCFAFGQH
jgi:hypothetical protein